MTFWKSVWNHEIRRWWIYIIVCFLMASVVIKLANLDPEIQVRTSAYVISIIILLILAPIGDTCAEKLSNYQDRRSRLKKRR